MRRTLIVALAAASIGIASDGKRIVAYGRDTSSGTHMYFQEHVLGGEDFADGIQELPGTAALINAVSKDANGIGYGGIGYVKGVKALKVKKDDKSPGVEPKMENVVAGTYPISRYLYLYTVGKPEGAAAAYIGWILSDEGQKVCADVGYFPVPADKKAKVEGATPADTQTLTVKGSDTMVILGQRWAENYMKAHPNVTIQVTGGGSGVGIAALINGTTNICEASRPMNDKERAQIKEKFDKEAVELAVGMDGIAIFVNEANPIEEISLPQLKAIYTGQVTTWDALGGGAK